jgi:hypothetical protein
MRRYTDRLFTNCRSLVDSFTGHEHHYGYPYGDSYGAYPSAAYSGGYLFSGYYYGYGGRCGCCC